VLENRELERLESLLGEFNPFVAMKWTRQETRHSQFLRWILDPRETHGLGAYFLSKFVMEMVAKARSGGLTVPSVIEVDSWDFAETQVETEWNNLDIIVRDNHIPFVAVIENKIDSGEHGQQLQRYRELVEKQFPDHEKLYVLLTLEGDAPSDEAYVSADYSTIASMVEDVQRRRADQLGPDVRTFMAQYVEMLRRHLVAESEIQELANKIYQTHRRALDAIFEHRPDRTLELSAYLRELMSNDSTLVLGPSSKSYVRFLPKSLDFLPSTGTGWSKNGPLILFQIQLAQSYVQFECTLGPGPVSHRELIHEWVRKSGKPFNRSNTKLYPQWWSFHTKRWIAKGQFESAEVADLKSEIADRLNELKDVELPSMVEALGGLAQIDWPSPAPSADTNAL